MIHEYPKGVNNRFKKTGDKWVQSLKHPQIKTYFDFYRNMESKQHDINLTLTEQEESYVNHVKQSFKPALFLVHDRFKFTNEVRPDDYELNEDISNKTLAKFIKQGRQNFTHVHKLTAHIFCFVILEIVLYFIFLHEKQLPKSDRVRVLNAEVLDSYHFETEQTKIQKIIQRMELVNGEYEKKLAESKKIK